MADHYTVDSAAAAAEHWKPIEAPPSLATQRRQMRQALARRAADQDVTVSTGATSTFSSKPPQDPRRRPGSAPSYGVPPPQYIVESSRKAPSITSSVPSVGVYTVDGGGKRRPGGETGGPKRTVHDAEALSEQVLTLKKELASSRAENKLLRVAKEKMEAVRLPVFP